MQKKTATKQRKATPKAKGKGKAKGGSGFRTLGAPGQDIFKDERFFPGEGGIAKLHLVGGPCRPGHAPGLPCPVGLGYIRPLQLRSGGGGG